MTHWKLTLAYDGTPYHGWQVQPGLPTVQGALSDAIQHVASERVLPQGSGRTDTGVHALGQVASFALTAPIPAVNFHRALNHALPPSIRVLAAEPAAPCFHARHSALRKTYEYRIFPLRGTPLAPDFPSSIVSESGAVPDPERICPPIFAPFVWPCRWPLSVDALSEAAGHILGTHDFSSFAASDPDLATRTDGAVPPSIRTIYESKWHAQDDLLIYTVTGSGFLHHMVRNLVGTFVQAGSLRLAPEGIAGILAARNRAAAGPTAPANGLFLVSVEYPQLGSDPLGAD